MRTDRLVAGLVCLLCGGLMIHATWCLRPEARLPAGYSFGGLLVVIAVACLAGVRRR